MLFCVLVQIARMRRPNPTLTLALTPTLTQTKGTTLNAFITTGNPFLATKLLEFTTGRGSGALKGDLADLKKMCGSPEDHLQNVVFVTRRLVWLGWRERGGVYWCVLSDYRTRRSPSRFYALPVTASSLLVIRCKNPRGALNAAAAAAAAAGGGS